jgi:hypothetical protein
MLTPKLVVASLAVSLALGAAAFATSASAATMSSTEQCTSLQKQFDGSIATTKASAKMVTQAKTLRTEGGTLCNSGKASQGVKKLQSALKDIGVKAKS